MLECSCACQDLESSVRVWVYCSLSHTFVSNKPPLSGHMYTHTDTVPALSPSFYSTVTKSPTGKPKDSTNSHLHRGSVCTVISNTSSTIIQAWQAGRSMTPPTRPQIFSICQTLSIFHSLGGLGNMTIYIKG